jgi:hypothetical protein
MSAAAKAAINKCHFDGGDEMIDRYTQSVLTIIALSLAALVVQNAFSAARAQTEPCGSRPKNPCFVASTQPFYVEAAPSRPVYIAVNPKEPMYVMTPPLQSRTVQVGR